MTREQFSETIKKWGLTDVKVGMLLGLSNIQIWRLKNGKSAINKTVAILTRLYDQNREFIFAKIQEQNI
jgi:plasmid maintenance system antidote protein VapI